MDRIVFAEHGKLMKVTGFTALSFLTSCSVHIRREPKGMFLINLHEDSKNKRL
jgi:hypothetical protein